MARGARPRERGQREHPRGRAHHRPRTQSGDRVARTPRQRDERSDQRHVRVAVGEALRPDLHEADHGHERAEEPQPADREVGPAPHQQRTRGDRE